MDKTLKDRLPLIEVKEITWAEAVRLMTKPKMELEPVVSQKSEVTLPYGEQALKPVHLGR